MKQNATAGRAGKVKAKTATTAKKPAASAAKKTGKKKRGAGRPHPRLRWLGRCRARRPSSARRAPG